jgi:hypothetical protein
LGGDIGGAEVRRWVVVEVIGKGGVEGVALGCVSWFELDVGGFGVVKKSKGYFIKYSKEIDW